MEALTPLLAFILVLGLGTMPLWLDALYSRPGPPPAAPPAPKGDPVDADTLSRVLIGDDWDGKLKLTGYTPVTADTITAVTIDADRLHVDDDNS